VRILDEVLKSIDDELANSASSLVILDLLRAKTHELTDFLRLHRLEVLDNLLKLTVKESSADISVLGANIAANLGNKLLDLLVGLALIQPVVNELDNGLTGHALEILLGVDGAGTDSGDEKSDIDCLHFDIKTSKNPIKNFSKIYSQFL